MVQFLNSSLTVLAFSALVAAAPQQVARQAASGLSLTAQLTLADLSTDRYTLLPDDAQFVFDFNKDGPVANRKTFPALVGSRSGAAVAVLEPCSIVPVHMHPRATELLTVLKGRITNYMIPEAGVTNSNGTQRIIKNVLTANMMTIQPQAAWHTIYNTDCEPVIAVASVNSEDMGAIQIANSFFSFDGDMIAQELNQAISGGQIDAVRQAIATRTVEIQECAKKCNITASR